MKTAIKCPHTGNTSSKRLISIAFCAAAILLSLILTILVIFIDIPEEIISEIASIIITFAFISGGSQVTTMKMGKSQPNIPNAYGQDQ